jgi:hypothetical protein
MVAGLDEQPEPGLIASLRQRRRSVPRLTEPLNKLLDLAGRHLPRPATQADVVPALEDDQTIRSST